MDSRRTARKRTEILTIKLHQEELEKLRTIADANHRSPAEQVRFWIATAPTTTT